MAGMGGWGGLVGGGGVMIRSMIMNFEMGPPKFYNNKNKSVK